ncbi:MAG: hypothetical protein U0350_19405 [Caldilineaceae bacterium]
MQLIENPQGNYRFLTGIAPYSAGVVALPGYEIARVTLHTPLPYRQGFALIDRQLQAQGRPRQALCAVELRLPKPLSFAGFGEFNQGYRALLAEWQILIGEHNPVARTNIAPAVQPPAEPSLYAFSYTIPSTTDRPTFIVAGAGDLRDQADLSPTAVVRPGETSAQALREKAHCVMGVMQERLTGLQMDWSNVTAIDLYTTQPVHPFLRQEILNVIGPAATHGVHWYYSHPPIADLAFEMDLRGVRQELNTF